MFGAILLGEGLVYKDSAASVKAWLSRHRAPHTDEKTGDTYIPLKRVGEGKDARWESNTGRKLTKEQAARVAKIGIPPAWTAVFMHESPDGKLQAFGFDKVGKKQPKYSEAFSALQAEAKWQRVKEFHKTAALKLAKQSDADMLDKRKTERERDTAAMVNLVLKTGFRPGSEKDTQSLEQAYGASTLEKRHIKIKGDDITFTFTGKKGVPQEKTLTDSKMARYLGEKLATLKPSQQVFSSNEKDALDYIKKVSGNDAFKTKDLRTWNGTGLAIKLRKAMPAPTNEQEYKAARKAIAEAVSDHLGNTPAMALSSYIAPYALSPWQKALGIRKAGDGMPTFDELMEIMDEATEDGYQSPVDWVDFDDEAKIPEVDSNYRDNLDGIQVVKEARKGDFSFALVLKDSASSKKAWITIKLKKHFGTADKTALQLKKQALAHQMFHMPKDTQEYLDKHKEYAALVEYLDFGKTDHLGGGPAKKPKPKLEPTTETPSADLKVNQKPSGMDDYLTPDEAKGTDIPKAPKTKFEPTDNKEAALAQNHELGKTYYKFRDEFGQDHPATQAAYAEWQKSKDELTSQHGYDKGDIGGLSSKSKEAYSSDKNKAAQEIANQKMKALADLKEQHKQNVLAGNADATSYQKLKDMGISDNDINYALSEGLNEAAQHKVKVKQAAETDLKKKIMEYEQAKDKHGADSLEAAWAKDQMDSAASKHGEHFSDSDISNMKAKAAAQMETMKKLGSDNPDLASAVEQYDSSGKDYPYIAYGHPKYEEMMKDAKNYLSGLPANTQDDISSYIGTGHKAMNKLQAGTSAASKAMAVKRMQKALDRPLPTEMSLRRNMSARWLLESFGMGGSTMAANKGLSDDELQSMVGRTYVEKAFSSTTYEKGQDLIVQHTAQESGAVKMNIRAGSATRGLALSNNKGEGEVLLQSGAMYVIRGVKRLNEKDPYSRYILEIDVDIIGHKPPEKN